ncbi:D-tyrosyl-tRNA(Tyr) deacylase [Bacillaceae bacterium SIJ1]|uniref:D-aminoacyl-tRNA deacylase n=1 Tax=Litoribacterium kuwaitense TaxID=1398745 RepID=UPI0013ED505D|nr:D-aminoacyl-tRNA deacylase [Litoribacterium kuwaitense]NGP43444.1 D-tyrosyl-tRNA(Tyr) deacylase [Litoribacterium kuwaitense]
MRVLIQRVRQASVTVDEQIVGSIDQGLLAFVGITHEDDVATAAKLATKIANLRIFEDEAQKMNKSLLDTSKAILSISQFTLYGDASKGRRPHFTNAARPDQAESLYEAFNEALRSEGLTVETGTFGAHMNVQLENDGPVTLLLEKE